MPKRAIAEAWAAADGVAGDSHAHPRIHGGPLQAILLISAENIQALAADGWPVSAGALGENVTTRGIDFRRIRPGQRFRLGEAQIEITKRRTPCRTLDVYGAGIQAAMFDHRCKANDPSSPKWGITGFYASVLRPGLLRAGLPVELLEEPC